MEFTKEYYLHALEYEGTYILGGQDFPPVLAALTGLADALARRGNEGDVSQAALIRADVEETEAIMAGYWEGVLEETRWELAEQQRAAAAVAAAVAPVAIEREAAA